jgi:hypothetical protein
MFVTKQKFCDERGLPITTIDGWIQKKRIIRGVHYVVEGRTTMVDPEAIEQWLIDRQKESESTATVYKSASATKTRITSGISSTETQTPVLRLPSRYANVTT